MAKTPPAASRRARALPSLPPSESGRDRREWIVGIVVMVAAATVYLDTLGGDFIYDDARQIVGNSFIQDGQYFWRAIFSDVWAFKGTSGGRVSNYWRPSFVLWLIANVRVFGLMSTVGWHIGSIALHALTTGLAFALLRRLRVPHMTAGAIALLFAVHPVHVESVAWISGSPDLILAPALLGSTWFVLNTIARPTLANWSAAIALYVVAQGAKEIAIFFPAIVALAVLASTSTAGTASDAGPAARGSWSIAFKRAAPFAALALVYLVARNAMLGRAAAAGGGGTEWIADVCSAPQVCAFYLRQIVFPLWIGPSYPLRPVIPATIDWMNFGAPLAVCVIAGAWMLREAWKSRVAALGCAMFVLPLAPAMHVSAFLPEQVVHDRYLYLPLLGFLMILVPAAARLVSKLRSKPSDDEAERTSRDVSAPSSAGSGSVMVVAVLLAAPLAFQTSRYNTAWMSEIALWEWGVQSDPGSAFNYTQLAEHRRLAAKPRSSKPDISGLIAARVAADRALELADAPSELPRPELLSALLVRADIATDQARYADAEADLRRALDKLGPESKNDDVFKAYTRLAICFDRQQRLTEAEAVLREARARLAHKKCALTEKLGVVLYRIGRKDEALRELESVRSLVPSEFSFDSRLVLFRLGNLYQETGRPREAQAAFREFLNLTANMPGEDILAHRGMALKAMSGG